MQDPRTDWPTYLEKESHDLVLQATSPADRANTDIKDLLGLRLFFIFNFFFGGKHCFCFSLFFFKVPIKVEEWLGCCFQQRGSRFRNCFTEISLDPHPSHALLLFLNLWLLLVLFFLPRLKSQVSFWVFIFPNIEQQTQTCANPQTFRYRVDQVKLVGAEGFSFLICLERVGSRKME